MVSSGFGISLLAHLTIILAANVRKLWDKVFGKKNNIGIGQSKAEKIFTSLAIAALLEFATFMIIISAVTVLVAGIQSDKSNFNLIKHAFYEFESKGMGFSCLFGSECDSNPPDVNIPLSFR